MVVRSIPVAPSISKHLHTFGPTLRDRTYCGLFGAPGIASSPEEPCRMNSVVSIVLLSFLDSARHADSGKQTHLQFAHLSLNSTPLAASESLDHQAHLLGIEGWVLCVTRSGVLVLSWALPIGSKVVPFWL